MTIKQFFSGVILAVLCVCVCLTTNVSFVFAQTNSIDNINQNLQTIYLDEIDSVKNRTAGTAGEKNMADNLVEHCLSSGYTYFSNLNSFTQEFDIGKGKTSRNVIAQKGDSAEKYIILGAHYDAVYIEGKSFGYNDNLSGMLAVMETARLINATTNFNVVLAFWGAEEVGCLGSKYFVSNLPSEIKNNILLYVNFDTVGAGDFKYYYANDFQTPYSKMIDQTFVDVEIKKYSNQLYAPHTTNDINYSSLALQSDNSSFLKAGINSLSYFSGNLETSNGFGYFETAGHPRIMHTTDSQSTIEEIFGTEHFVENIAFFAETTSVLLQSADFNENVFSPNQVPSWLYSDVYLKLFGVGAVVLGFGVYLIIYFKKYKNNIKTIKK